jgi:hypothetical protein
MKEIFKKIITDFIEKELNNVKKRNINVPLDTKKIVSLVGIRRSGKTYILFDLINELRKKIDRRNVVYINFEDDRLFGITLRELDLLLEGYFELFPQKREEKLYFFFDEIQEIENWEKFIRRIYDNYDVSIYITGSSSKLLSKEISTSLRGRSINFEVFPLSFREFLEFKGVEVNLYSSKSLSFIKNALEEYLKYGGFPEIIDEDDFIKREILQSYTDLIIYRDLIERYKIKNLALLKYMIKYLFSNPATLFSFTKFYNFLKTQGFRVSKETIMDYYSYLEDVYAVFGVKIFRNSIKEQMRNPLKNYIVDNGFFYIFNAYLNEDYSKIYENTVFMHLRRKTKNVFYYKLKQECDFYADDKLINVSYDIEHPQTLKREIDSLKEAMEFFSRDIAYLITKDKEDALKIENKTIKIIPLYKFLLDAYDG